jgi:predicted ATPase
VWLAGLVDREAELRRVLAVLDANGEGDARVVLEGEAGIGKTALSRAGLDEAQGRGFRILEARPALAEQDLAFAALGDLLRRINRRMWLLMDSDRGEGDLKPAVQRLQSEVAEAGTGGTWITNGYTIENYVDPDVL